MGEYEPNDSRNVKGAKNQQTQQDHRGGRSAQPQQFQDRTGQMGGSGGGGRQVQLIGQIREHMEVIGADGVHVGTVDAIEGDRIKLTKREASAGFEGARHEGHHHFLPLAPVAEVEGDRVRLSANGGVAYGMEEEEGEGGE